MLKVFVWWLARFCYYKILWLQIVIQSHKGNPLLICTYRPCPVHWQDVFVLVQNDGLSIHMHNCYMYKITFFELIQHLSVAELTGVSWVPLFQTVPVFRTCSRPSMTYFCFNVALFCCVVPPRLVSTSDPEVLSTRLRHVRMSCNFSGSPRPTLSWYKNGQVRIPVQEYEYLFVGSCATLCDHYTYTVSVSTCIHVQREIHSCTWIDYILTHACITNRPSIIRVNFVCTCITISCAN